MPKTTKNYDPRCLDLAKVFLADECPSDTWDDDCDELADLIQRTIEDHLQYGRQPKEASLMPRDGT